MKNIIFDLSLLSVYGAWVTDQVHVGLEQEERIQIVPNLLVFFCSRF